MKSGSPTLCSLPSLLPNVSCLLGASESSLTRGIKDMRPYFLLSGLYWLYDYLLLSVDSCTLLVP
jgi:hypothetical protein